MKRSLSHAPGIDQNQRLPLRPWAFENTQDVLRFADDPELGRFPPIPKPFSHEHARKFIAAKVQLDPQEHPTRAIEHEGHVMGGINLRLHADAGIGEIGYSIDRAQWGRGFDTEAAGSVLDAAFENCSKPARVRAMADARNRASIRVLEKIAMRRERIPRANRYVRDEPVDEVWCGIKRSEWIANCNDASLRQRQET